MRGVAKPERTGFDRLADLDEDRPVIFAANHHSHVDTPLLITSIPEPWRHKLVVGAAADYFFATRVTGALSALAIGAIPIERTRVNRKSADLAAELIDDGWSILIFPEGGRSPDGWGQPFRGGAAYLSVRTDVPVVPDPPRGHRPHHGQGDEPTPSGPHDRHLRQAACDRSRTTTPGRSARASRPRSTSWPTRAATDWWSARRRAARAATPVLTGPEGPSWRRAWALGDRKGRTRRPSRSLARPRLRASRQRRRVRWAP